MQEEMILNTKSNFQMEQNNSDNQDVVVLYVRVSLNRPKYEGYSLERQIELGKIYANQHGWYLPEEYIFKDEKPASKIYGTDIDTDDVIDNCINRPAFQEILKLVQKRKIQHLIVYSRDRLTRVFEEAIAIEHFLKKHSVDIHYTKQGENINIENNALKKLIDVVLYAVSEYEAGLLSIRINDGNKTCALKGLWPGGYTPLGFIRKYVDGNINTKRRHTTLVKSDFESYIVDYIFSLYIKKGYGYKRITDLMNTKFSYIHWTQSKIASIIKNQTYTGNIVWGRRGGRRRKYKKYSPDKLVVSPDIPGAQIISKETWNQSVDLRSIRASSKDSHYQITPFFLKGKLICEKCNEVMKSKNPGKNKSNIYKCTKCKTTIATNKVHYLFCKNLNSKINFDITGDLWKYYDKEVTKNEQQFEHFTEELKNRIIECTNSINALKKQREVEKNEFILSALDNQYNILSITLDGYKNIQNEYENYKIIHLDKDKFKKLADKYIINSFSLFDTGTNKMTLDDLTFDLFHLREFVIKFVDSVYINCNEHEISAMKIIVNLPLN